MNNAKPVTTESDLVIPALRAMAEHEKAGLTTADLQGLLRVKLNPTGEDLEPLEGRNDDKFSQKVRNLKSHDRLEREGIADYLDGRYYINEAGKSYLESYGGVDESYSEQGFSEAAKSEALRSDKTYKFIEEGSSKRISATVRRRSKRLRDYAIKHFADDEGRISCDGCGFEASSVYGEEAKGLIEIHHTEPVAISGQTTKPLAEAIKSLTPLCPNCHRMVHKGTDTVLSIDALRDLLGIAAK